MAGMDMSHPESLIDTILMHASSGTSIEPISTPHDMLMKHLGALMLMFHGDAFVNSQQQTGPRGGDKASANWIFKEDCDTYQQHPCWKHERNPPNDSNA